jgi:hypothetical protein
MQPFANSTWSVHVLAYFGLVKDRILVESSHDLYDAAGADLPAAAALDANSPLRPSS